MGRIRTEPSYRNYCDVTRNFGINLAQNPAIPKKAEPEHSHFVSKNTHSPEKASSPKAPFGDPSTHNTDIPHVDPLISQKNRPLIHIEPIVAETGDRLPDEAPSSKTVSR